MNVEVSRETIPARDHFRAHSMGDKRELLEELFSRYRVRLYNTALRLSRNHADAEDALQDGMLAAFCSLNTFEGRSQLSTWLTRIVVNAALMRRRCNRTRLTVSIDQPGEQNDKPFAGGFRDPGPNPEEIYARQERFENLERALQTMPRAYQQAMRLRHLQGMTIREAAETLGLPTGTLKSQLHRARQWLNEGRAEGRPMRAVSQTRMLQQQRAGAQRPSTIKRQSCTSSFKSKLGPKPESSRLRQ